MKKTWHIARNELYTLFYSPIAWAMFIVFFVLTSADYIDVAGALLKDFKQRGPGYFFRDLTVKMTVGGGGFLSMAVYNLYLFMPLITMGLISREVSSGTIKLLYSSPVKTRQIVLGKYLSLLCFTLCLVLLLFPMLVMLSVNVVDPDYGQLFASVCGLFIVLSTYAAIGLFVSSLTSYQVAAAIITSALFLFLRQSKTLWQDIDLVRDITYYMAIGDKVRNLVGGLFNLRDFTYCLIITGSFLAFTIIKIKSAAQSISRMRKAARYVAVVAVAFIAGYITSRPTINFYIDSTRRQLHTISPGTQATLRQLNDGELEITAYVNLLSFGYYSFNRTKQNELYFDLWERYIRFKPDTKINYVYYYNTDSTDYYFSTNPGKSLKEIAEKNAAAAGTKLSRFLTPEAVKQLVDVQAEENRCFFVFKYKNKTAIVRSFDDPLTVPSQHEIAAGIGRLVNTKAPKIAFLCDEIERSPYSQRTQDYRKITSQLGNRHALINQGYDFDTLSLKRLADVPADFAALVIADPRTSFTPESLEKINRYIDNGGNLYLSTEPDRLAVTQPLLDKLGITARPGMIIQSSERYSADLAFAAITDTAKSFSPEFINELKKIRALEGDTVFFVSMPGASVLDYRQKDGFMVHPLAMTDSNISWNRIAPISKDSLRLKVGRLANDESGSFATALRLSRPFNGKEQRIIVTSDADYLTSEYHSGQKPARVNKDFGFWCMSYFSYGKFPVNTLRAESTDNAFKVITVKSIPTMKLVFYWIIPALIGVIGSVILIRRKRK